MEKKRIFIGTVDKALNFIGITNTLDARIYLVNDNAVINANSLLAVLSLNLQIPWKIEIKGEKRDCMLAIDALKDYLLE